MAQESDHKGSDGSEGNIDIAKILLPKKETPGMTLGSAQRVNAAQLLEQEQSAEFPKPAKEIKPPEEPKKEESIVQPLQTYQGDIEKVVQQKNISLVSMASAEAERRAEKKSEEPAPQQPPQHLARKIAMVIGGVVLIAGTGALIAYSVLSLTRGGAASQPPAPETPYISVDDTVISKIDESALSRTTLMQELLSAREHTALSLGLMARIIPAVASTSGLVQELGSERFLTTIAPDVPEELTRTLDPRFVFAIYSYDGNQPLLILKTDSYERAFSGMLAWEETMRTGLLPLFDRKPPVRAPLATTTATSTEIAVIPGNFVDRIIDNHDARVIQNEHKDILLLWTLLDRQTILITTNEAAVRETLRRLKEAPTIVLP